MERFYLSNYEGNSDASDIKIAADKTVRLPDRPCKFVMLSNWTVSDVPTFPPKGAAAFSLPHDADTATEVYYGFNGRITAQLFAGQSTVLLPVSNLSQICVRSTPGMSGVVWYAWFW